MVLACSQCCFSGGVIIFSLIEISWREHVTNFRIISTDSSTTVLYY